MLGWLLTDGLHSYIFMCEHERAHKNHWHAGILGPRGGVDDPDNDGLKTWWEEAHHLDPNRLDTTGQYLGDLDGDSDCIADIEALGAILPTKGLWLHDWSENGLQWGQWGPRNMTTAAYFGLQQPAMPFHPWSYRPSIPGAELQDPPVPPALIAIP